MQKSYCRNPSLLQSQYSVPSHHPGGEDGGGGEKGGGAGEGIVRQATPISAQVPQPALQQPSMRESGVPHVQKSSPRRPSLLQSQIKWPSQ